MQVPIESLLDLSDIFYSDDSSDADLFAFFLVGKRGRHGAILCFTTLGPVCGVCEVCFIQGERLLHQASPPPFLSLVAEKGLSR